MHPKSNGFFQPCLHSITRKYHHESGSDSTVLYRTSHDWYHLKLVLANPQLKCSEVNFSIWRQWIRIGCEGLTLSFENRNICTESLAISTLDSESTLDLSVFLSLGHSCCSYKVRFCSSKIHMDAQIFVSVEKPPNQRGFDRVVVWLMFSLFSLHSLIPLNLPRCVCLDAPDFWRL